MELNTAGSWTRMSSMLCSSLLLTIITFFVLAVPGHVNSEKVGLAEHTLDLKLAPNTKIAHNNETYNEYKKRNPHLNACNVIIIDKFIELLYDGKGCTVDILSNYTNKIVFKAGVRHKDGKELSECLQNGLIRQSYENVIPFTYSADNEIFKNLDKGPLSDESKTKCKESSSCTKKNGTCLPWTSLEVSWSKSEEGEVFAFTHLIGEVEEGLKLDKTKGETDIELKLDLEINAENKFSMKFAETKDAKHYDPEKAVCVPKSNSIVKPIAWSIPDNQGIKGNLLVFHLLPLTATFVYTGTMLTTKPKSTEPNCNLFIQFDKENYSLLTVDSPTTQATTNATTGSSSTGKETTPPTAESKTTTTAEKSCPTVKTTTNGTIGGTCEKSSGGAGTVILILLTIILLGGIGALIWFLMKEKAENKKIVKKLEESEQKLSEAQAAMEKDKKNEEKKPTEQPPGIPKDNPPVAATNKALQVDKSKVGVGEKSKTGTDIEKASTNKAMSGEKSKVGADGVTSNAGGDDIEEGGGSAAPAEEG